MSKTTIPMAMLLQDPSLTDLHQDYMFSLERDFFSGMSSSKFSLRDDNKYGVRMYPGLNWLTEDISFASFSRKKNLIDNPQFHQVNTFAVASHTLDMVERAIGRDMQWKHGEPLILRPHAFAGPNAFYDPESPSLNFGWFASPFRRTPVWTCLSHDIIAHELGHAVLDSFRPLFLSSEEVDTGALHESFSDLLSLFSVLEHKPVVEHLFRESGGDMMNPNLASELAEEFGIGLWGVSLPYLRSALKGVSYDDPEAPFEVHGRSTIWTAAIYEILATLVNKAINPEVRSVLEKAPATAHGKPFTDSPVQMQIYQAPTTDFAAYYAKPDNRSSFDKFYEAIVIASKRGKGMMLRALQDIPPNGVTFPTLAHVLYDADARLFPDDPYPREVAKTIFKKRGLWNVEADLQAPDIGEYFESLQHASPSLLTRALFQHADALRIPVGEGAYFHTPQLSTITRTINADDEQRDSGGLRHVTEHYLYYTYAMPPEYFGYSYWMDEESEEDVMDMMGYGASAVSIFKGGGTLIMDENWKAIQLTTSPETYDSYGQGEGLGAKAMKQARERFIQTHRQGLKAMRDGIVRPDGTLPNGQPALPFRIAPQSSGPARLERHRCNLKDHIKSVAGKHLYFPFDVDQS